jgi:hypothetical protein
VDRLGTKGSYLYFCTKLSEILLLLLWWGETATVNGPIDSHLDDAGSNTEEVWNDIDSEEVCLSATLCPTNPMWTALGANPDLRGEKPANNRLSNGTALTEILK